MKKYESNVDWRKLLLDVKQFLNKLGARYYSKKDLCAYDEDSMVSVEIKH